MINKELLTQKTYTEQCSGKFNDLYKILNLDDFKFKINVDEKLLKGKDCIDIACGVGRHTRTMSKMKPRSIIGIDITKYSIEMAKKYNTPGIKYFNMSVYNMPESWKKRFDYVLMTGCLMHMRDPKKAIKIASTILKDNGYISLWVYERQNFVKEYLSKFLRVITTRMNYDQLEYLCRFFTKTSRIKGIRKIANIVIHTSPRHIDNFDNFSVPFFHRFTEKQLKEMLKENGIHTIRVNYYAKNHGLKKLIHGKYGGGFGIHGEKIT